MTLEVPAQMVTIWLPAHAILFPGSVRLRIGYANSVCTPRDSEGTLFAGAVDGARTGGWVSLYMHMSFVVQTGPGSREWVARVRVELSPLHRAVLMRKAQEADKSKFASGPPGC